ncbi:MAG: hypothetical protein ACJ8IK_19975 [Burkholderiaceae bacterium]
MNAPAQPVRSRRRAVVVIAGIACALLAIALFEGQRNYAGYCADTGRVLSNRELILHALNSNLSTIGRSGASSAEDFMARYPDCCSVYRESVYAPQNWFDRVLFGHRQSVGILVHVPPEVHSGIHYSRYEVVADVRACGEPGATYGNLAPDN